MKYGNTIPEITLKYKKGNVERIKITNMKICAEVLRKFYDEDTFELTESMIVLFLNQSNQTIGWMKHSTGGMGQTLVDPRLIYATALKCGAAGIIVSHNHPSGALYPSPEDNRVTEKLKDGANYLNIRLLDHIILTDEGYYSYVEEGKL